jgi:ribosomal protein L40E
MQIRHKKTNRKALSEIPNGGCYYDPEAESYNILAKYGEYGRKEGAMMVAITRVFEICNAYESGYGHGYEHDGHDDDYYHSDDLNEAYHLGYAEGMEQSAKEAEQPSPNNKLICLHCGYEQLTCFRCGSRNTMMRVDRHSKTIQSPKADNLTP